MRHKPRTTLPGEVAGEARRAHLRPLHVRLGRGGSRGFPRAEPGPGNGRSAPDAMLGGRGNLGKAMVTTDVDGDSFWTQPRACCTWTGNNQPRTH